jgi:hypothetical protein
MAEITGKIIDNTGEPLTGANVFISDSSGNVLNPPTGVSADIDGNYKIKANVGDFITVSFVGMEKKTIKVGSALTQNFTLSPSASLNVVEVFANKTKKTKVSTGIIIFFTLAGLLLIAGGVIEYNDSR